MLAIAASFDRLAKEAEYLASDATLDTLKRRRDAGRSKRISD